MYGLAVNLIVRVSGHPWIINEIKLFFYRTWVENWLVLIVIMTLMFS